jgi:hypothetical protein
LINHLLATNSNHCPILLSTAGSYRNILKPFHFKAFWTRDQSSHGVVAGAWLAEVEGSLAFSLSRKWNNTKVAFKHWNTHHFGHIQTQIKILMVEINGIQASPHSLSNVARESFIHEALQKQLLREEVLWKQKSRELWLSCTDLNTKLFHASTACRRRYNSISCLSTTDGSRIIGMDLIGSHLVNHFHSLFSTTNASINQGLSVMPPKLASTNPIESLTIYPFKSTCDQMGNHPYKTVKVNVREGE